MEELSGSAFLQVTGHEYHTKEVKSLEQSRADMTDSSLSKEAGACHVTVCVVRVSHTVTLQLLTPLPAFQNALYFNWGSGTFLMGFQSPHLIDIPTTYGWTPENFESLVTRLVGKQYS